MTTRLQRIALGAGAVIIALGVGAGVYASPQNTAGGPPPMMRPGGGGGMRGPGPMGPMGMFLGPLGNPRMMAGQLGLSDTQQEQIKSIVQSHRDEWKALGDRAIAAHRALQAAVTADTIDEPAIRDKSTAVSAVAADVAVAAAHARAEIFQVLTPDQQAKAKALRAQMEQRVDQRRGSGGPGRPRGPRGGDSAR